MSQKTSESSRRVFVQATNFQNHLLSLYRLIIMKHDLKRVLKSIGRNIWTHSQLTDRDRLTQYSLPSTLRMNNNTFQITEKCRFSIKILCIV
jgi:hypothetical protein